ncbi:MAG: HAMP domain-containing sensor histidine kinase [Acidimicrobiales bacterium]
MSRVIRRLGDRLGGTARVVIVVIALIAVAFAVTGIIAVRTLRGELIERVDDRIVDDARATALALDVLDPNQLADLSDNREIRTSTTALLLIGGQGQTEFSAPSGPRSNPDPLPRVPPLSRLADRPGAPFTTSSVDGSLDYRAVASTVGGTTVVVAAPLDGVDDTVATLGRRLLGIGAGVLSVLGILIWAVVTTANRQVDNTIDTAGRIAAGDLSARIGAGDLPAGTASGRLGLALNDMLHQLEAAFAAQQASEDRLRRFAADASHELRTPLTHIRGYAELLTSGAATSVEDQARALGRIESEAARMATLVDDLLLLARLDQGPPLAADRVDLTALIADSVDDARIIEPRRPFTTDLPPHPVTITGDDARLRQVFANLIANIRTHTTPGTAASVTLTATEDSVVLRVSDAGPGMTDAAAARAFDRFYRPEDSRSRATGGSGLGLAITAAIINAHHGTITLDTAPGEGTRFTVALPRSKTARSQDVPSEGGRDGSDVKPTVRQGRTEVPREG